MSVLGVRSNRQALVVERRATAGAVVLSAIGALDMFTVAQFRHEVEGVLQRRPCALIIDLARVYFLASVGVGALVDIGRSADQMPYAVVTGGAATSRPLAVLSIDTVIGVYCSVAEALSGLGMESAPEAGQVGTRLLNA